MLHLYTHHLRLVNLYTLVLLHTLKVWYAAPWYCICPESHKSIFLDKSTQLPKIKRGRQCMCYLLPVIKPTTALFVLVASVKMHQLLCKWCSHCSVCHVQCRVVWVQSTGDSKLRQIEVLPDNEWYGNCFRPLELASVHEWTLPFLSFCPQPGKKWR